MSYDTPEASVADGRPYFLYVFATGALTPVRLTSEPVDLVRNIGAGDVTFSASPLSHNKMEQTGHVEKQELELKFPLSDAFAITLLLPATAKTTLTIYRGHYSDLSNELRTVWKGRVSGSISEPQTISVKGETIFTSLRRTGCNARVQRTCRHALYLPGCNLNKADFAEAATATAVNGLVVTVTEATIPADGFYKAGMINWNGRWGFIDRHVGTSLVLVSEIVGLEEEIADNGPAAVTIYRGCDRSTTVCDTFPNAGNLSGTNIENHGGFPYRPPNNPFNQSIV